MHTILVTNMAPYDHYRPLRVSPARLRLEWLSQWHGILDRMLEGRAVPYIHRSLGETYPHSLPADTALSLVMMLYMLTSGEYGAS